MIPFYQIHGLWLAVANIHVGMTVCQGEQYCCAVIHCTKCSCHDGAVDSHSLSDVFVCEFADCERGPYVTDVPQPDHHDSDNDD